MFQFIEKGMCGSVSYMGNRYGKANKWQRVMVGQQTFTETVDHCWKYIHDFNWENKKIMDYEANTITRKIKETIHSLSNNNHINGISYRLPHIWFPALKLNPIPPRLFRPL